jgi:hypothetical protein
MSNNRTEVTLSERQLRLLFAVRPSVSLFFYFLKQCIIRIDNNNRVIIWVRVRRVFCSLTGTCFRRGFHAR